MKVLGPKAPNRDNFLKKHKKIYKKVREKENSRRKIEKHTKGLF